MANAVVPHGFDLPEHFATDVAEDRRGLIVTLALVNAFVDQKVIVLGERSVAEATLVLSGGDTNLTGAGHCSAAAGVQRVDGKHLHESMDAQEQRLTHMSIKLERQDFKVVLPWQCEHNCSYSRILEL